MAYSNNFICISSVKKSLYKDLYDQMDLDYDQTIYDEIKKGKITHLYKIYSYTLEEVEKNIINQTSDNKNYYVYLEKVTNSNKVLKLAEKILYDFMFDENIHVFKISCDNLISILEKTMDQNSDILTYYENNKKAFEEKINYDEDYMDKIKIIKYDTNKILITNIRSYDLFGLITDKRLSKKDPSDLTLSLEEMKLLDKDYEKTEKHYTIKL